MRIILALDTSLSSEPLIEAVCAHKWPSSTEFRILTVVEPLPLVAQENIQKNWGQVLSEIDIERQQQAELLCVQAREKLLSALPDCIIHFEVRQGHPQSQIVDAAAQWSADKIILGAKGRAACPRFLVGSVSNAVVNHAPCSVEIIRKKEDSITD